MKATFESNDYLREVLLLIDGSGEKKRGKKSCDHEWGDMWRIHHHPIGDKVAIIFRLVSWAFSSIKHKTASQLAMCSRIFKTSLSIFILNHTSNAICEIRDKLCKLEQKKNPFFLCRTKQIKILMRGVQCWRM